MSPIFSVLTILLASCFSVRAEYVSVTGQTLLDLGKKVGEELSNEILTGLKSADISIKSVQPSIASCLSSVESQQTACASCINIGCQDRSTTLQCPANVVSIPQEKIFVDYQVLKSTVEKSKVTIELIVNKIKYIVEKVIGAVKTLVEQGVGAVEGVITDGVNAAKDGAQTIEKGIKTAAETVKNVAENTFKEAVSSVKQTVESVKTAGENVIQKVGNAAENIVNKAENIAQNIGDKVEDAAKDVVKAVVNTAEDAINAVKNVLESIGRRKRLVIEPTCDMFSQNPDTCLFYQDMCQSCDVFGTNGAQANLLDVITKACGADLPVSYETLVDVLTKVDGMTAIVENFALSAVQFNPASAVTGGFQDVLLEFKVAVTNYTLTVSQPVLPFDVANAGPAIAKEIFNQLFP